MKAVKLNSKIVQKSKKNIMTTKGERKKKKSVDHQVKKIDIWPIFENEDY